MTLTHSNHHSETGSSSSAAEYDAASGHLTLAGAATERWPVALPVSSPLPTSNTSYGMASAIARFQRQVDPGDYLIRLGFHDVSVNETAVQRGVSVLAGQTMGEATVALVADATGGACRESSCDYEDFDLARVDFACPSNCSSSDLVLTIRVTVPDLPNRFLDVEAIVDIGSFAAADGEGSATFEATVAEFTVERVQGA